MFWSLSWSWWSHWRPSYNWEPDQYAQHNSNVCGSQHSNTLTAENWTDYYQQYQTGSQSFAVNGRGLMLMHLITGLHPFPSVTVHNNMKSSAWRMIVQIDPSLSAILLLFWSDTRMDDPSAFKPILLHHCHHSTGTYKRSTHCKHLSLATCPHSPKQYCKHALIHQRSTTRWRPLDLL